MSHINTRILNVILKELNPYFDNLKISKSKKGKSIEFLKFDFKPEIIEKIVKSNQNKTVIGSTEGWYEVDKELEKKYRMKN